MSQIEDDLDPKQLAAEFLADRDLEDIRNYLLRGRAYAGLTTTAIEEKWIDTFRQRKLRDLSDLAAELHLRKQKPPFDRIDDEAALLNAELKRRAPGYPHLSDVFEKFLSTRGRLN